MVFHADATDPTVPQRLMQRYGQQSFDVIIDDASHAPADIAASFQHFFVTVLSPGGIYAVEDTFGAYRDENFTFFEDLQRRMQFYRAGADFCSLCAGLSYLCGRLS